MEYTVTLPVRPGEIVWTTRNFDTNIYKSIVIGYYISQKDIGVAVSRCNGRLRTTIYKTKDFGKKVFFTKQDAQDALRKNQSK